jgi:dipeptidyl aminopeptidase/acylaminoacyl peptidase
MTTPYGEWPSPIAPEDVAAGGRSFGGVDVADGHVYWLERRPSEGGRGVVCRAPVGERGDTPAFDELTPAEFDVRTLVHQYGGGDFAVAGESVVVANMSDQRLYRLPRDGTGDPTPITPEPAESLGLRYADVTVGPDGDAVYAVRERHVGPGTDDEPANELVRISLSPDGEIADPTVIASGHDFYAAPRPSPDGDRFAYLRWDHPNMPWDGTELVVAATDPDGGVESGSRRVVAGGDDESVCSPSWSPDGSLHAVSDRTGWWNLYRIEAGAPVNRYPADAEFGVPMWVLGLSTYAFLDDGRVATLYTESGKTRLRVLEPADAGDVDETGPAATGERSAAPRLLDPELPYTSFRPASIRSDGERVVFVGHRPDAPSAVVEWSPDSDGDGDVTPTARRIREATDDPLAPEYISTPEAVTFPTGDTVGADDAVAYAYYYPPHNPDVTPPDDERPPLVVTVHGGPTSRTDATLSTSTQFLTTRGVAVLDVNYRGSTGYGRRYREALDGEWGVRDTLDCVNAARYAAAEGLADPDRLAISGGSAGGYAVLSALAFHDTFDAGTSYYGVADLAALSAETHKFESRYLDGLVGPLPDAEATYRERSPLYHAGGIAAPLLLLQGGKDEVVPPAQAAAMIDALVESETPYAYVEFPEERHGFRDADAIARAHAAEFAFYGAAFGFTPAGDLEPVRLRVGERPPEFE